MLGRFFRGGKVRPGFFFPWGKICTGILFRGRFYPGPVFPGGGGYAGKNICYNTGRHSTRLSIYLGSECVR